MPLLSGALEATFQAWDDLVPYKDMELKIVSGSNTEDYTSQLKDTKRWNLNRLTTHVAIYVHFIDCTSAQIKKKEMQPHVSSTFKF